MPYRRRTGGRTYYRRRATRRRTMWARMSQTIGTVGDAFIGIVDLLYWLKNPTNMPAGGRAAGFTPIPDLNAIVAGQWPSQPITGATVLRVLGAIYVNASTPPVPQQVAVGIFTDNGNTGLTASAIEPLDGPLYKPSYDPANILGMQEQDWMMHKFAFPAGAAVNLGAGQQSIIPIDVRSKRKLSDWGDSLYLSLSPSGPDASYISHTAVLLGLP